LLVIDTMQLLDPQVLQCNMFSIKLKSLPYFAEAELAQAKHSDLSPLHNARGHCTFWFDQYDANWQRHANDQGGGLVSNVNAGAFATASRSLSKMHDRTLSMLFIWFYFWCAVSCYGSWYWPVPWRCLPLAQRRRLSA